MAFLHAWLVIAAVSFSPNAFSKGTTPTGETALHAAAAQDDVDAARRLLKEGANPNASNMQGVTPLVAACQRGSVGVVDALLKARADVNAVTADGRTPLMVAARTGRPDVLELLLSAGAKPGTREPSKQQDALMWAAAEGHADAVSVLLRHGAKHTQSKEGFTALLFAVRQGHADVARKLLQAGADVNQSMGAPGTGPSALGLAIINRHYELGAMLLNRGADPRYVWKGRTALHVITWIRKPGAGSNDPPLPGSGTLDSLDLVKAMVAHGADVNARMTVAKVGHMTSDLNLKGATPFLLAARTADAELMRLLVKLGADPLIPNEDKTTPLMVAAGVGVESVGEDPGTEPEILEAVKAAVELGNDVNAVDLLGETAMHGAAYKGAASSVPYLVAKGANMQIWNQKNKKGWTPLRIAAGTYRVMNLRSSPATMAELNKVMRAAGVSTALDPLVLDNN